MNQWDWNGDVSNSTAHILDFFFLIVTLKLQKAILYTIINTKLNGILHCNIIKKGLFLRGITNEAVQYRECKN